MKREVKLYGPLAKFVGRRRIFAEVASAGEAIRMLLVNFPGLERHMAEWHYKVVVDNYETDLEGIANPVSGCIQIIPVVAGAGFWSSFGKILAGVALVAFAVVTAGAGAGFMGLGMGATGAFGPFATGLHVGFTLGSTASALIGAVGASLILGGTAQLLSPTPQVGTLGPANSFAPSSSTEGSQLDPQGRDSYSFSGIQNTSAVASAIPVVYGETVVGSVVISAGLDVDNK
jgi:predicted phage tail protein